MGLLKAVPSYIHIKELEAKLCNMKVTALVLILEETGLFTLLKIGFAFQNDSYALIFQKKLKNYSYI